MNKLSLILIAGANAESNGLVFARNQLEMNPEMQGHSMQEMTMPGRTMRIEEAPLGYSFGQGTAVLERIALEPILAGMAFEWVELAYQEKQAGNAAIDVFRCLAELFFSVENVANKNDRVAVSGPLGENEYSGKGRSFVFGASAKF